MTQHLPECPKSGCPACYEAGMNQMMGGYERMSYEKGHRDALADAKRIVAGFLDIDEAGDRRCSDPLCDMCVVAPLIYAALEDLILSKGDKND